MQWLQSISGRGINRLSLCPDCASITVGTNGHTEGVCEKRGDSLLLPVENQDSASGFNSHLVL